MSIGGINKAGAFENVKEVQFKEKTHESSNVDKMKQLVPSKSNEDNESVFEPAENSDIDKYEEKMLDFLSKKSVLTEKLETIQDEINRCKEDIDILKNTKEKDNDSIKSKITNLEKQAETKQKQLENLQKQLEKLQKQIEIIEEEINKRTGDENKVKPQDSTCNTNKDIDNETSENEKPNQFMKKTK